MFNPNIYMILHKIKDVEWANWFAWRPVRTQDGEWVWWMWIEREMVVRYSMFYGKYRIIRYRLKAK